MTAKKPKVKFDAEEVEIFAFTTLKNHGKVADVIGTQIFSILERYGRVLYYPLCDEDIWGFVEKKGEHFFICINTSIDYDKQVFVAAHELYHVLQKDCSEELTLAQDNEDSSSGDTVKELKANRFAAAYLVNESLLKYEMQSLNINAKNLNLHRVLKLANIFIVPYKTMVRRLFELKIINGEQFDSYMDHTHSEISIIKKRMGLMTPTQDHLISLDNLNETAMQLYESDLITIEKLTHILKFSELTPEEMGITTPDYTPLTDDQIDALMGSEL